MGGNTPQKAIGKLQHIVTFRCRECGTTHAIHHKNDTDDFLINCPECGTEILIVFTRG